MRHFVAKPQTKYDGQNDEHGCAYIEASLLILERNLGKELCLQQGFPKRTPDFLNLKISLYILYIMENIDF